MAEDQPHLVEQEGVGDRLPHLRPQRVGAGLGGEGDRAVARGVEGGEHPFGHRRDADRGDRGAEAEPVRLAQDLLDVRMIAHRRRHEAELVGHRPRPLERGQDVLGRVPAEASHAEGRPAVAALLGTAARHLDQELLRELGVRGDDRRRRQIPRELHLLLGQLELVELRRLLAPLFRPVEGGDVEAVLRRQALDHRLTVLLAGEGRHQVGQHVLGGADGEDVDELRHRQRIDRGAGAPHHDHRVPRSALAPAQRDVRPVEHLQEVDVVLLEGDREGDAAEIVERPPGLDRQRHAGAVGEEALARPLGIAVDHLVDPLEAQARHRHVVGVGIGERQPVARVGRERLHGALGGADRGPVVCGRFFHGRKRLQPPARPREFLRSPEPPGPRRRRSASRTHGSSPVPPSPPAG